MRKAPYPIAVPHWPFAPVWWTDHCARDRAAFWSSVAIASDPMEVAQAQRGLARDLRHDSLTIWAEFALAPMRVWGQVADDQSTRSSS
ncbi:MAG: hypothetical protein V4514_19335 [Pseudomonadota bacterium]|uniref:hypothetical protein n=1 Tax=Phenylobacterium sp. TaxID=1871053 RepID=UPI0025DAD424|nr:hypothetical protein [Phenylobacterium sp.]MBT9471932.1 hypothetical protein [Phenylobacterium sp.]